MRETARLHIAETAPVLECFCMNKYEQRAKRFYDAGFRVYGLGNFDVSVEEFAEILALLDDKNSNLQSFYQKKYEERMG